MSCQIINKYAVHKKQMVHYSFIGNQSDSILCRKTWVVWQGLWAISFYSSSQFLFMPNNSMAATAARPHNTLDNWTALRDLFQHIPLQDLLSQLDDQIWYSITNTDRGSIDFEDLKEISFLRELLIGGLIAASELTERKFRAKA